MYTYSKENTTDRKMTAKYLFPEQYSQTLELGRQAQRLRVVLMETCGTCPQPMRMVGPQGTQEGWSFLLRPSGKVQWWLHTAIATAPCTVFAAQGTTAPCPGGSGLASKEEEKRTVYMRRV